MLKQHILRNYDSSIACHEINEVFADTSEASFIEYLMAIVHVPSVIWSSIWLADVILLSRHYEAAVFPVAFGCQELVKREQSLLIAVLNSALRSELLKDNRKSGIVTSLESSFRIALHFSNVFRFASLDAKQWLESAFLLSLRVAHTEDPARFIFAIVIIVITDNTSLLEVSQFTT